MDDFNDFYNRFVVDTYGVNVLNYLFFLAAFFISILFGVIFILLKYKDAGQNGKRNGNYDDQAVY